MYASNEDEEDWVYLHETPSVKNVISSKTISQTNVISLKFNEIPSNKLMNTQNENCILSETNTQDDLERENHLLEMMNTDDGSLSFSHYIPSQQSIGTSTSEDHQSIMSISQKIKYLKNFRWQQSNNDTLISYIYLIVIFILPFILGLILTQRNQSSMLEIMKELQKTNQRLDEIKVISIGNFEKTLTEKFEEKLQNIINEQIAWYEHEKLVFRSQIQSLEERLDQTQRNFTETINQLNNENQQLKQEIKHHEYQHPKNCLPGVNCTQSSRLTFDNLVTNLFKRTASIAIDTSGNLSYFFERLSASISKIVDDRHIYLAKSKRKLTDLTNRKISQSFHQAKTSYASWIKTQAQTRMRMYLKPNRKFPWRWTFSRGPSRLRMFPELSKQEQVCSSKFDFPLNGFCSMKNWMIKFFR